MRSPQPRATIVRLYTCGSSFPRLSISPLLPTSSPRNHNPLQGPPDMVTCAWVKFVANPRTKAALGNCWSARHEWALAVLSVCAASPIAAIFVFCLAGTHPLGGTQCQFVGAPGGPAGPVRAYDYHDEIYRDVSSHQRLT